MSSFSRATHQIKSWRGSDSILHLFVGLPFPVIQNLPPASLETSAFAQALRRTGGGTENTRARECRQPASPSTGSGLSGLPPFARRFEWGGRGVGIHSPPWPAVALGRRRLRASVSSVVHLSSLGSAGQRRAYGAGSGPSPSGFGYVLSVFLHSFAIPVLNYLQWPVTSQINGQASIPRYVFEGGNRSLKSLAV